MNAESKGLLIGLQEKQLGRTTGKQKEWTQRQRDTI